MSTPPTAGLPAEPTPAPEPVASPVTADATAPADAAIVVPVTTAPAADPHAAPVAGALPAATVAPPARALPMPPRALRPLRCRGCHTPLAGWQVNADEPLSCSRCRTESKADVFPAFFHDPPPGREGEPLRDPGEATCYYHHTARAELVCDGCGRFLCATCDLPTAGRHLCPPCLKRLVTTEQPAQFISSCPNWDGTALLIAIGSLAACLGPSIIGAPLALTLVIHGWRHPQSPVRPASGVGVAAMIIAGCTILGWIGLLVWLIYRVVQGR